MIEKQKLDWLSQWHNNQVDEEEWRVRHDKIPERLRPLFQTNPIVNSALQMYLHGKCSLEDAMVEAIVYLVNIEDIQTKEIIEAMSMRPAAPIIMRNFKDG